MRNRNPAVFADLKELFAGLILLKVIFSAGEGYCLI
jgi:hypothetical protein